MEIEKQFNAADIPYLSTEQMREVDRAMIEDYGITLIQMMENAGRNLAALARQRFLDGDPVGKQVIVLAGKGGNGGGGLVCARRLHSWGAEVSVFLGANAEEFRGVPATQLEIVEKLGLPVGSWRDLSQQRDLDDSDFHPDLIIDALFGYSLSGAPRGGAETAIRWANRQSAPILSLDVPSGVEATTGCVFNPAIVATATMTLALPKQGLRSPEARSNIGELYLADIGVPPEVYTALGLTVPPIFAASDVIRIS